EGQIGGDVAQDICELEGDAEFFREVRRFRIVEFENVQASETDGAGYAIAIFAEAAEGGVARLGEIHFYAGDQIVEIARRNVVAAQGVGEGWEDWVRAGVADDGLIEHGAPAG